MSFDYKSFDPKSMQTLRLSPAIAMRRTKIFAPTVDELLFQIKNRIPVDAQSITADIGYISTTKRAIGEPALPETKYDLPKQSDPTRTYITWNEFGITVANKLGEILLNPPTDAETLKLKLLLMQEELMAMFDEYLWLMMMRADMFAVEYMNRIDPAYHFTTEWTPANDALFTQLLEGCRGYLTTWTSDIQTEAASAINEHAGESAEQIGQAVADVINSEKNRGTLIARTELMRAFNSMAEQRYKNAGFRMIWLTAQDPTVCEVCEPLHGRPIDEIKVTPPAHPNCRCTIIPQLKTEEK